MSKTLLSLAAATLIMGGLASVPTAAQAATAPAHKSMHKMSCYDYAWDSQQQKDCLQGKPAAKKTVMKKKTKKAAPKTTS